MNYVRGVIIFFLIDCNGFHNKYMFIFMQKELSTLKVLLDQYF